MEKKHTHNPEVINALAEKYSFTPRYIRMILDNERTPVFQDRIIREYRDLTYKINSILKDNQL